MPSPSDPFSPGAMPDSSSDDVRVRDAPGNIESVTPSPGDRPESSMPVTATWAAVSPGLISLRRLGGSALSAGLKVATRCRGPSPGAASCIAARNPSGETAYDSTSISSSLANSRRQSPKAGPIPEKSALAAPRPSKSAELK